MKKIIASITLAFALIGGFAFVAQNVSKSLEICDPGGGRPPGDTETFVAPANPTL